MFLANFQNYNYCWFDWKFYTEKIRLIFFDKTNVTKYNAIFKYNIIKLSKMCDFIGYQFHQTFFSKFLIKQLLASSASIKKNFKGFHILIDKSTDKLLLRPATPIFEIHILLWPYPSFGHKKSLILISLKKFVKKMQEKVNFSECFVILQEKHRWRKILD